MNMKQLIKNWSLPDRSAEKIPVTLRLPYDVYASLHALKEVYPHQSVNEIARDILRAGISEISENLPTWTIDPEEAVLLAHDLGGRPEDYAKSMTGPRVTFDTAYRRIMEEKKQDEQSTELRAVQ